MQSKVAYTKPVDHLSGENFNLGLTSAHRRLKNQDKTVYTSFASTLIPHTVHWKVGSIVITWIKIKTA